MSHVAILRNKLYDQADCRSVSELLKNIAEIGGEDNNLSKRNIALEIMDDRGPRGSADPKFTIA